MTNARGGNAVVAFARRADGHLRRVGSFPTGGTGSGSFEDTAHGLVLGTSQEEASPNNLIEDAELLFATNARSDSIAVFRVEKDELVEVDVQPSGGEKPVSVTVNRGVLYVLNSGEATDDLFDSEMHVIPNCTTGTPSITGFTVGTNGELDPIAGSTRRLSELGGSGCAQVSFNPAGNVLVVTERLAKDEGPPGFMGDEGVISTYTRNADGTLSTGPVVTEATGSGPFGFTFNKAGDLFTTEQFDGIMGPGLGAAARYGVGGGGSLAPQSPSVGNGGTDTCWFVITDDGRYGYASSFFGDGRISIYRVDGGRLVLLEADASSDVAAGASDLALSRDSRYLYSLNSIEATITVFRVGSDGRLRLIEVQRATRKSPMFAGVGLAAS